MTYALWYITRSRFLLYVHLLGFRQALTRELMTPRRPKS